MQYVETIIVALAKHLDRRQLVELMQDLTSIKSRRSFSTVMHALDATIHYRLIDVERFEQAPCYLCGYNSYGYYQTTTHLCANKYHFTKSLLRSAPNDRG
jgi:hypothetical protein